MVVEKDFVGMTCLSFAAGTGIGALSAHCFSPSSDWPHILASVSGILLFSSLAFTYVSRRKSSVALTLFFCGLFCYATAWLTSTVEVFRLSFPERCSGYLERAIDSIPFTCNGENARECNALLTALLTGNRSDLSPDIRKSFRESGASHILALSGMHMGIIYLCLSKILSILGRSPRSKRLRSCSIIVLSGFFTLMTGAAESLVRAFFFIAIREICALTGRHCSGLRTLYIALTLQLATNPLAVSSPGFQLSYLAMAGIFILHPVMESWYPGEQNFDPVRRLWSLFSLSISCQLFTAPLSWLLFGSFPEYFLITNLFAMPLTTLAMGLSLAVLAVLAVSGTGRIYELLVNCDALVLQSLIAVLERIAGL